MPRKAREAVATPTPAALAIALRLGLMELFHYHSLASLESAFYLRDVSPPASPSKRRHGFTLIELLTVIAIVSVVVAIAFPVFSKMGPTRKQTVCLSNLRHLVSAVQLYANEHNNQLPPIMNHSPDQNTTWLQAVAPYLGIPDMMLGSSPKPRAVGVQICPAFTPKVNRAVSYGLNVYMIEKQPYSPRWGYRTLVVPDLSKTFIIGEINGNVEQISDDKNSSFYPEFRHPNQTANWAFLDGHVEAISLRDMPNRPALWKWW